MTELPLLRQGESKKFYIDGEPSKKRKKKQFGLISFLFFLRRPSERESWLTKTGESVDLLFSKTLAAAAEG